jgi:hypothetical protein
MTNKQRTQTLRQAAVEAQEKIKAAAALWTPKTPNSAFTFLGEADAILVTALNLTGALRKPAMTEEEKAAAKAARRFEKAQERMLRQLRLTGIRQGAFGIAKEGGARVAFLTDPRLEGAKILVQAQDAQGAIFAAEALAYRPDYAAMDMTAPKAKAATRKTEAEGGAKGGAQARAKGAQAKAKAAPKGKAPAKAKDPVQAAQAPQGDPLGSRF